MTSSKLDRCATELDRGARLDAEIWFCPGSCPEPTAPSPLLLLGTGGKDWAAASPLLTGDLPGRCPRRLSLCLAASRPRACRARLRSPAPIASTATRPPNGAKSSRLVRPDGASSGDVLALAEALYFAPRPHQHAGQRSRARPSWRRPRAKSPGAHGASIKVTEGSEPALRQFPDDPRGRTSERPGAPR